MEKVGMYYNMFYLVHPDINIYICCNKVFSL
jgi:hypothetical protein